MKKKSTFRKSLVIALVSLVVIIAIILLYNVLGLPAWPFIILLVCMSEVYHLDASKFWSVAISGAVGMVAGYVETMIGTILTPAVTTVIFLVLLLFFVAMDVEKNKIVANICCMINFNIILNVPGVMVKENMLPAWGAYALGVVILYVAIMLLSKLGQKGKQNHAEAEAS